ncbi:MAG: DUF262 domain-containing HNH endonuclease family protein [Limnohabitans sp.]|nr:DUF262 domain-containing HNH endonuclease family protein [Limnohabitans sp.]
MSNFFSPEPRVINELFGNDIVYNIPEYQRAYSWDCIGKSDRNNQVNVMWEDLYQYFNDNNQNSYFLGSMVVIQPQNNSREYEVIDGQQRLTTLTLLFVAMKCFLRETKQSSKFISSQSSDSINIERFIDTAIGEIDKLIYNVDALGLIPEKKVKILKSQSGVEIYDKMLSQSMDCNGPDEKLIQPLNDEQKEICRRYFKNRDFFIEKLKENFWSKGNEKNFGILEATRLNDFTKFLRNNINIVFIRSMSFDVAYHIFEILNNRGLPLSNKDLFRNFLIKEFDKILVPDSSNQADKKWNELDKNFTFRDDFLGRWVESRNGSQQKYSAFNDLKEIFESTRYNDGINKKKIEYLYDDIKEDLGYYTLLQNPDNIDNAIVKSKIKFLMNSGNIRYTTNLLMALFRYFKFNGSEFNHIQELIDFLTHFEVFNLNIIVAFERYSNKPIYEAIKALNERKLFDSLKAIEINQADKKLIIKEIKGKTLSNNTTAKLLISKYIWVNESNTKDDVVEQSLYFDKATLEHIIPQNPENNSNWKTDFNAQFLSDYIYCLGNMTLLTTRSNSAARNFDFEKKKKIYAKTKLAITHELTALPKIDEDFIRKRQDRIVTTILKDLALNDYPSL